MLASVLGWSLVLGLALLVGARALRYAVASGLVEWEGDGGRLVVGGAGPLAILTAGGLALAFWGGGIGLGLAGGKVSGAAGGGSVAVGPPNAPTHTVVVIDTSTVYSLGSVFVGSGADTQDSIRFAVTRLAADTTSILTQTYGGAQQRDTISDNTNLKADTTYRGWLKYKGASGGWSAWSAPDTFVNTVAVVGDTLVFHNFNDSTDGAFSNPWGASRPWTFPNDPTGGGMGRVARTIYAPASGDSQERGLVYVHAGIGVGDPETWFKGQVYIPDSTAIDPDWNMNHTRKLIDWQGGASGLGRIIVGTYNGSGGVIRVEYESCQNGTNQIIISENTSFTISTNTWTTIEMRYKPNSASGVTDGELQLYFNGESTPTYSRTTGLALAGSYACSGSAADLNDLLFGYQLTIDSGHGVYNDHRYWDNVGIYENARP